MNIRSRQLRTLIASQKLCLAQSTQTMILCAIVIYITVSQNKQSYYIETGQVVFTG
jgi:hypothetical protein